MAGSKHVMGKLTLRSLRARWIRFVLTSLAVVMGVAFVVGSFVLADTLQKVFDTLAGSATIQPRRAGAVGRHAGQRRCRARPSARRSRHPSSTPSPRSPESPVPRVPCSSSPRPPHRTAIGSTPVGAPVLGFNWDDDADRDTSVFKVVEGNGPRADDEMALDRASADKYHIKLGDKIIAGPGASQDHTVSGVVTFADGGAGAYYMLFTTPAAQQLANLPGQFQPIDIRADAGVNEVELRDRVADALPDGYEAVPGSRSARSSPTASISSSRSSERRCWSSPS